MVTGPMLLVIFALSIALLLLLIIKFDWQPFLALLLSGFFIAFLTGIDIPEIPGILTTGFGSTLTGIGIVIALGVMLGELLNVSGATQRIATSILEKFGVEKSPLAVAFIGYVVSIPVFFDAAFVILISLLKQLSFKTKIAFASFVTSLAMGLIITHSMVIPTPGPLIVAENFGVDLGLYFIYAVIVTIPAVITAGFLYPMYINKKEGPGAAITEEDLIEEGIDIEKMGEMQDNNHMPSSFISYGLLALPIILILLNTLTNNLLAASESSLGVLFGFIGDKNVALFITVLLASYFLKPFIKKNYDKDFNELYVSAVGKSGMILLITGAGGAFGNSIVETGIGDYLISVMNEWSIPIILFAFVFSQILRSAQGSATAALVTASATIGPIVGNYGTSPILVALAVGAGAIGLSLPNDSGFWVVNRFSNFTMQETFKTWTFGGTIGGLTALFMIFILSLFSGVLPGL
jgi:GntP family gluconate:H+ symporter